MKHTIIYSDPTMYAGWPANHGAWQWGDHFLVGFLRGRFNRRRAMHAIEEPFERMLARSLDGGQTWQVESPKNYLFEETAVFQCLYPFLTPKTLQVPDPFGRPPLTSVIHRVCGVYDHGGDECYIHGGFYSSSDYGRHWFGPYSFDGLEDVWSDMSDMLICTARTRVLDNLFFLSAGQQSVWGTDFTFCARYANGKFEKHSIVLADNARAVMPAVVQNGTRLVVAMRRRKTGKREGWIDSVYSDDDALTWSSPVFVGATGGCNGNPPALLMLNDGRILCCFGNRDHGSIAYSVSEDGGETWPARGLVREGNTEFVDIGYPQLFLRSDGVPICVYYWADLERPQQHIVATEVLL